MQEKYGKIVVLAGGPSNEREISLKSGRAIHEALRRKNQDVDFVDVDENFSKKINSMDTDIVFIALHGKFGEDGSVQLMLEKLNLSYTGSEVEASRLALDKVASRELFLNSGLKVPRYKVIKKGTDATGIFEEFEIPFVVKPQCEGSSIGLSIVSDRSRLKAALEAAFTYGETVVVEEYIPGRELTVGILEGHALPVIEITTKHNVYDFNAKYMDRGTKYIVPAMLDKDKYKSAQEFALKAHRVLGCRDFSRVDMRMDRDGNIYVLEVNTIPGMTERSLLPKAASAIGVSFEDLCMKLVDLAYRRRKNEETKNRNY